MQRALADIKEAGCNALCVYLGNFGPEISETMLAQQFGGPKMFVAAAEENIGMLSDDRGDAYCGMLNASYNLKLRGYIANGEVLPVATRSFGSIGVFAIPEMGRFYRHVLIEKNFSHHGARRFSG